MTIIGVDVGTTGMKMGVFQDEGDSVKLAPTEPGGGADKGAGARSWSGRGGVAAMEGQTQGAELGANGVFDRIPVMASSRG